MKISAYILAADPAWIVPSVRSYYDVVDEIVVSYDERRLGWTGHPIPVDQCIDRLKSIDSASKIRLIGGDFFRPASTPMENDTFQRQHAIDSIVGADWILQIDTDEILPSPHRLVETLRSEVHQDYGAVEWPMRAFFHRVSPDRFLEVTWLSRRQCSEYPGAIAIRPGIKVTHARRSEARAWRVGIRKQDTSLPTYTRYRSDTVVGHEDAILHMSWVRDELEIRNKLRSWSHSKDFDGDSYLERVWIPAPRKWLFLRDFHPVYPKMWPALWPVKLPQALIAGGPI